MKDSENTEENEGVAMRRVTLSLPKEIHDAAVAAAEFEDRSLSNFVGRMIKRNLKLEKEETAHV